MQSTNTQSTNTQSTNAISAIGDTFLAPSKVFNGLKNSKGWSWLAIALVLVVGIAAQALYFKSVDPTYFVEQQVATMEQSGEYNPADIQQAEALTAQQFPMMWIFSAAGVLIITPIILSISALYFSLIAKQDPNCQMKYGDWFGFSIFTILPTIFASLGTIILVLTAQSGDLPLSVLTFSSLNQLIFGFEPSHAFAGLLESINIFSFWSLFLSYIGLKSWTNFSDAKAFIFALLPSILIYGIWFVTAAL
jgi:hypothetical protein